MVPAKYTTLGNISRCSRFFVYQCYRYTSVVHTGFKYITDAVVLKNMKRFLVQLIVLVEEVMGANEASRCGIVRQTNIPNGAHINQNKVVLWCCQGRFLQWGDCFCNRSLKATCMDLM